MKKIDIKDGVPILSWCPNIEDGALNQATDAAKHPCVFKHVAIMADSHRGYGVPIGAVVALKDAISPNMVGVDISCGITATKTSLLEVSKDDLLALKDRIKKLIPVGSSTRSNNVEHDFPIDGCFEFLSTCNDKFSNTYKKKVEKSIGTLGGGKMTASSPRV